MISAVSTKASSPAEVRSAPAPAAENGDVVEELAMKKKHLNTTGTRLRFCSIAMLIVGLIGIYGSIIAIDGNLGFSVISSTSSNGETTYSVAKNVHPHPPPPHSFDFGETKEMRTERWLNSLLHRA